MPLTIPTPTAASASPDRGPIVCATSQTAPATWLDDEIVLLSAGVTLTLPAGTGRIRVKAMGAGCYLQSAAEIEYDAPPAGGAVPTTTDPVPLLAIGEVRTYASVGGPWYTAS